MEIELQLLGSCESANYNFPDDCATLICAGFYLLALKPLNQVLCAGVVIDFSTFICPFRKDVFG